MRFLFKTDYDQDIRLAKHGGHVFWHGLLCLFLVLGLLVFPSRLPAVVADDTLPAPQTSYGTQKLICEHLVADYTRKGYIDGRSARLMTVTVRPGRPYQCELPQRVPDWREFAQY